MQFLGRKRVRGGDAADARKIAARGWVLPFGELPPEHCLHNPLVSATLDGQLLRWAEVGVSATVLGRARERWPCRRWHWL